MKIAGGQIQEGIVIGNTYDKYGSQNPIVRLIMNGFDAALDGLVDKVDPATIHEVGCGAGGASRRGALISRAKLSKWLASMLPNTAYRKEHFKCVASTTYKLSVIAPISSYAARSSSIWRIRAGP